MFFILRSFLFCLIMGCEKQPSNISSEIPHATVNSTSKADTHMAEANIKTTLNHDNYSWLALGDSYTIGESVKEDERFPAQTISLLKKENLFIKHLQYVATTGWTTLDLLNAIASQNPQGPFDIVTLLIGVNDQYQHLDTGGYRIRFTQCLKKAIALAGDKNDRVFVLSIPDYSVTPFAQQRDTVQINREIDEFNYINKAIALSFNISYTDITPLTSEMKNDASLIAFDGLHPSAREYAKWAPLLAPEIAKVLK